MEHHIFISYSTKDKTIAFKIVDYLESHGHPCWIAPRDITSGMDYTDVINEAIAECSALVLVFSESSTESLFVKKELTTAVSYKKTILPFKISDVELKGGFLFMLNNVQWIDASTHPEQKFSQIINGLEQHASPDDFFSLQVGQPIRHRRWIVPAITIASILTAIVAIVFIWPSGDAEHLSNMSDSITNRTLPLVEKDTVKPDESGVELSEQIIGSIKKKTNGKTIKPEVIPATAESQQSIPATEENTNPPIDKETESTQTVTDFSKLLGRAKLRINQKKYKPALDILETLKCEDPNNKEVDVLIKECQRHLNANN